ncbi:MAG: hypothetical protein KKB20_20965 [Proteobacteria bacterium]|nr:hypothetical protein [Pseudomonadota bacterium]
MREMKPADLTPQELAEIKALEARLGRVCLVAVRPVEAMYAVEAKLEPNVWVPVDQVYPEFENLNSYYQDREDAAATKTALKNLLRGRTDLKSRRRPIRVRRI